MKTTEEIINSLRNKVKVLLNAITVLEKGEVSLDSVKELEDIESNRKQKTRKYTHSEK